MLFWEDQKADGWTQNYFYRGLEIILYQVSINERKVIRKPVVLFVDGHTSHINLEVVKLSREENIVLYCLLEHAIHLMQPCDVGLFGPLKREWRNSVKEYQIAHLGDFVTKQIFAEVFKSAWENATTVESAIKGFKNSGLYPVNRENIDNTKLEPSSVFQISSVSTVSSPLATETITDIPVVSSEDATKMNDDTLVVSNQDAQAESSMNTYLSGNDCNRHVSRHVHDRHFSRTTRHKHDK